MKVYLGADHRGHTLKEKTKEIVSKFSIPYEELGNELYNENDDYPDFAFLVASKVSSEPDSLGIVICGSGVGVDIAANKVKGIRSALGFSSEQIKKAREDDNINILSLPADFIDEKTHEEIVHAFLFTPFLNTERFTRRIEKIHKIENGA